MPISDEQKADAIRELTTFAAEFIKVFEISTKAEQAEKLFGKIKQLVDQVEPAAGGGRIASTSGRQPPVRELQIKVKNGQIVYDSDQWEFHFNEKVKWVSQSGSFTIAVDGLDELPSPFEYRRQIQAKESGSRWETDEIIVQRVWTDAQISAARSLGTYYSYVVALSGKDGRVIIDKTQTGRPDC